MDFVQAIAILSLKEGFTIEELKSAYKKKALETHPDRNRNNSDEEFKLVLEAYNFLLENPKKERIPPWVAENLEKMAGPDFKKPLTILFGDKAESIQWSFDIFAKLIKDKK